MRLKALDSDAHVSPKCAESSEELTGAARTKIVEKTGGEVGASGSPTTTKVVAKVQASVKQKLRPRIRNRAGGEEGGKGPTDEIGSPIASSPVEGRRSEEQSMSSKSLSLLSRQEKISLDTVSSQVSFDCPVYTRTHRHFSPSTPPRKNEDERRTAESQHRVSRESGSLGEKREIRERKRQKSLSREGMKRRQRQTTEAFAQKRSRDRRRRVPLERERQTSEIFARQRRIERGQTKEHYARKRYRHRTEGRRFLARDRCGDRCSPWSISLESSGERGTGSRKCRAQALQGQRQRVEGFGRMRFRDRGRAHLLAILTETETGGRGSRLRAIERQQQV